MTAVGAMMFCQIQKPLIYFLGHVGVKSSSILGTSLNDFRHVRPAPVPNICQVSSWAYYLYIAQD